MFSVRFSETHGVGLVCCVVYRFVLAQCFLTALTALTELGTATPVGTDKKNMCYFFLLL